MYIKVCQGMFGNKRNDFSKKNGFPFEGKPVKIENFYKGIDQIP